MKKILLSVLLIAAIGFTSCEKTGFTLNPKQIEFIVLEGEDYNLNVKGNGYNIDLTPSHRADGFNVKNNQVISVSCVKGDSVLIAIGGDTKENYRNGVYMNEGEVLEINID